MELTFENLGLSEAMLKALEAKGYGYPTTIQAEAIPEFMQWKDVIAKAPTGTGKTFAFGIPMIEHVDAACTDVQGLILAPTRELAIQIGDELRGLLTYFSGIRVAVLYGGAGIGGQIKQLERRPQIVVATPGRLMDHYNRKTIRLDKIQTVVLDEADRMLDMGFFKDVTRIIDKVKNRRNLGLFSATISQEVMTVSWMYQRDEVEITVEPKQEDRPDIAQFSLTCTPLEKAEKTLRLIRTQGYERVIIFCNTKHMCQRLCDDFQRAGMDCDCIHGDIRQSQREKTMQRYRDGKLAILVATDVASRGIDVDDVDCVVNYDVPEENEYYVHRIGRTGRAKRKGVAWSIIGNFPEKAKLDEIAKFCDFIIKSMVLGDDGSLTEEVVKAPSRSQKEIPLNAQGFLLLTSHLGNPQRRPLTGAQLRTLANRVLGSDFPREDREMSIRDLTALGYGRGMAEQILSLLGEEEQLEVYLARGKKLGCTPITRMDEHYPLLLRQRLGQDSPGCLWAKGDVSLLAAPAIALVGSRDLKDENREFARQVGLEAARQGLTLVSGNARGADRTAQDACLQAGGRVISVVADELAKQPLLPNVLYLSEEDFDTPFTAQRALSRNRVIHCLGRMVFVAQAAMGQGGTWDGTAKNLRFGWTPVACFSDGSEAARELEAMGAYPLGAEDLGDLGALGEENRLI